MNDLIVQKVDHARLLLAEARDASEAKKVADLARAAEVYARRQKLSEEAIAYATAVRVDAMTLMGEFLKTAPKNQGAVPGKTGSKTKPVLDPTPTLADHGIGKKESSDAQALAALKESEPDLHEEVRAGKKTVSRARAEKKRREKRKRLAAAPSSANGAPRWQLIHDDWLGGLAGLPMSLAPGREEGRPRLIFMDPPYNIGIDYGDGAQADRREDGPYLTEMGHCIAQLKGRLTSDGSLWVLINDEYAAEFGCILKDAGLTIRNWIKWYETFGVNCSNKFNRCSRHLFYCVVDPKRFVFHPEAVSRLSDRQTKYGDARANPEGKLWDDVWPIPRLTGTCDERLPDFPTQLPLALLRPIIACASDPGDLVLDPFCGSATTGVAAIEAGRRFVGIEKQKRFIDLATLRLKGVSP